MKKNGTGRGAGVALVMLSALMYGATPMLTKQTYALGSNSMTSSLMRATLALPLLVLINVVKGEPLKMKRHELLPMTAAGLCGGATMILLASSYAFIPVGTATVLHFVYPVIVAVLGRIFFGNRLTKSKLIALVLSVAGILCFFERGGSLDLRGVALALGSGLTFAMNMLLMERPAIRDMWYLRTGLYNAVFSALCAAGYGLATGTIRTDFDPVCFLYMFAVSVLTMMVALPALKVGVRRLGGLASSVLSTLEPISSVILGAVIFKEVISLPRLLGCVLVLSGVIVVAFADRGTAEK